MLQSSRGIHTVSSKCISICIKYIFCVSIWIPTRHNLIYVSFAYSHPCMASISIYVGIVVCRIYYVVMRFKRDRAKKHITDDAIMRIIESGETNTIASSILLHFHVYMWLVPSPLPLLILFGIYLFACWLCLAATYCGCWTVYETNGRTHTHIRRRRRQQQQQHKRDINKFSN